MNETHYSSLITLGFVSVSLVFAYFTLRDTEPMSDDVKKKLPRQKDVRAISSIALWLKIVVGLQTLSLIRTFF